jgi:hypothetical protein
VNLNPPGLESPSFEGGGCQKHIRSIFAKLDLSPADRVDRRVAVVLHYLEDARVRSR